MHPIDHSAFGTHGIFGTNEWEVDLFFAAIDFNNMTSHSLQLSPIQFDEGHTPYFPSDLPRMTSQTHINLRP